jgi:hypothetical protein
MVAYGVLCMVWWYMQERGSQGARFCMNLGLKEALKGSLNEPVIIRIVQNLLAGQERLGYHTSNTN